MPAVVLAVGWLKQVASAMLLLAFVLGLAAFIGVLRAGGFGPGMAAIPGLNRVSPAEGAHGVPLTGDITLELRERPPTDPVVKLEPVGGVRLGHGTWTGSTFSVPYAGLRAGMTYHAEVDLDLSAHGEHRQAAFRWSFVAGGTQEATPTASFSPTASPGSVQGSPSPSPSSPFTLPPTPVPSVRYGPPLSPGPYIWYAGGYGEVAVSWSGQDRVGLLWLEPATQSPDGSRLWYGGAQGIGDPRVFDQAGALVGRVDDEPSAMWSDDSRMICEIVPGTPAELVTVVPGSTEVPVLRLTGQSGTPLVESCSGFTGTAVIAFESNSGITAAEVISLRSSSVVNQLRYPNPVRRLLVTRDGQYAAEVIPPGSGAQVSTIFERLADGKVMSDLVGFDARGFSWDGSLVAGLLASGTGRTVEVIQWPQEAPIVWHLPYPGDIPGTVEVPISVIARPNGTDLALAIPYTTSAQGLWDLYIVHADGTSHYVLRAPIQPGF